MKNCNSMELRQPNAPTSSSRRITERTDAIQIQWFFQRVHPIMPSTGTTWGTISIKHLTESPPTWCDALAAWLLFFLMLIFLVISNERKMSVVVPCDAEVVPIPGWGTFANSFTEWKLHSVKRPQMRRGRKLKYTTRALKRAPGQTLSKWFFYGCNFLKVSDSQPVASKFWKPNRQQDSHIQRETRWGTSTQP